MTEKLPLDKLEQKFYIVSIVAYSYVCGQRPQEAQNEPFHADQTAPLSSRNRP